MKVDAIHEYLRLSIDDVGYWSRSGITSGNETGTYKGPTNERNRPWMRLKSMDNTNGDVKIFTK